MTRNDERDNDGPENTDDACAFCSTPEHELGTRLAEVMRALVPVGGAEVGICEDCVDRGIASWGAIAPGVALPHEASARNAAEGLFLRAVGALSVAALDGLAADGRRVAQQVAGVGGRDATSDIAGTWVSPDCPHPISATLRWAPWSPPCHDFHAMLIKVAWADATPPATAIWCAVCQRVTGNAVKGPQPRDRNGVIVGSPAMDGALGWAAAVMRMDCAADLAADEVREIRLTVTQRGDCEGTA